MILYALTIFASAFLLFLVQPIVAKEILPWFGGSASVWATCLVFFQSTLLAGYGAIPSYRAMLDREGVGGPEDIAVVGDEDAVGEQLAAIADAGVTDLNAAIIARSRADAERTTELLRTLDSA